MGKRSFKQAASILIMMIMLPSLSLQSYGQDTTFVLGDGRKCPFEVEHIMLSMPTLTNLRVTVLNANTDSYNDFYLIVYREGTEEHRFYLFQNRIPDLGENWLFGPLNFNDEIDLQIFSRYLNERTPYEPDRPGKVLELAPDQWKIRFEDWCDNDWNDLIVDVKLEVPVATINILQPSHLMSFVTDNASTYKVEAEGLALDEEGHDLSDNIDWHVYPGQNSGDCSPEYLFDSRLFKFTCTIPPRPIRGPGPLQYSIVATALIPPHWLPIWDLNMLYQDDIDTVRQQYVDYSIKLPYKSRFELSVMKVIIPTEEILIQVFDQAAEFYREWAADPDARFKITSSFRSPDVNRQTPGAADKSLHQYGLAIDIGYGDYHLPGQRDDSRAIYLYILGLRIEEIYPLEHRNMNYNHVHVSNFRYRNMPYVER